MGALLAAAGLSGGLGLLNSGINNIFGGLIGEYTRKRNYYYNELAATNAMNRQISLYNQIQSPAALMKQYKEAGLSPSLMFGGTPGQGSTSGAPMGAGPSGPAQPFAPASMIEAAQAANLMADTAVKKEEAKNISKDTELKQLQQEWDDMRNKEKSVEFKLSTAYFTDPENPDTKTSIYEIAKTAPSYEAFVENINKKDIPEEYKAMIHTEYGQKVLRNVYITTERFEWNISTLSSETVSANFQKQIVQAMQNTDFTSLNAQAACKWLEANIQTAELTETQKEAWNNLISRLGKKGDTLHDVIVVLGMIINNAASNWHMPSVNNHTTNNNVYQ